ncbi:MAG: hypothetical protein ABSC05_27650 [Candidatus Solibacter sp.]|jgi:hypothetical protein
MAQNPLAEPDPFAGTFRGDGVRLEMSSSGAAYAGTLSIHGEIYVATMKVSGTVASGSYDVNGLARRFTLTRETEGFMLTSGTAAYRLMRRVSTTLAPEAAQGAADLVGRWRDSTSSAQFNTDGTAVVNGNPGRYEIHGNRLTLIGAQAENTARFEVHGDVLALTVNGKPVTLNRVKEEVGEGSVRVELVGKWCWISLTEANQARKFSRCLTLTGGGSYAFAGETDSHNPKAGANSPAADSGNWTATETSLTTHSLSGKATTYRLERRNHPGKVRDPMIVLDGQAYVSFYTKTPW